MEQNVIILIWFVAGITSITTMILCNMFLEKAKIQAEVEKYSIDAKLKSEKETALALEKIRLKVYNGETK